ncbi:MAG: CDP-archaeol synthase [Desulfurococcaceae archaeon]
MSNGLIEPEDYLLWVLRYYLPPMIANAFPVLIGGTKPIDGGKLFVDNKPIFGKNKTWEGLLLGVIGAYIAGSCIGAFLGEPLTPLLALGAGFSALLGDLLGAFIKRRLSIKPGDPAPLLDQWDFALAVTAYYYLLGIGDVVLRPLYVVTTLLLILALHVLTNVVAYALGLKHSKL